MAKVLTAKVPITKVPIAKVQGQAVVAAAVRADLDQAAQPALQPGQLAELVGDRGQLGLGRPDDLVGGPGLSGAEQVADLGQGEAESLGRRMKASRHRSSSVYSRNPDLPRAGCASNPRR
jgi:hypothetical protein